MINLKQLLEMENIKKYQVCWYGMDIAKNYIGEEPDETSESCFYKDLYMIYRIPITEHMRKMSEDGSLLKIKVSDKGVQSVKKLKQKAINLTPDEIKY